MVLIKKSDNQQWQSESLASGQTHTVLGPEAEFEGKLTFRGAVRIDGKFRGEILSEDALVIGESADICAQVRVGTLVVNGSFHGDVKATVAVEIRAPAKFLGNINAPRLTIEPGAFYEGSCKMETEKLVEVDRENHAPESLQLREEAVRNREMAEAS